MNEKIYLTSDQYNDKKTRAATLRDECTNAGVDGAGLTRAAMQALFRAAQNTREAAEKKTPPPAAPATRSRTPSARAAENLAQTTAAVQQNTHPAATKPETATSPGSITNEGASDSNTQGTETELGMAAQNALIGVSPSSTSVASALHSASFGAAGAAGRVSFGADTSFERCS